MKNKLKKENIYALIFSIMYRIAVDWGYFNFCIKRYDYYGFIDNRTIYSFLASWLLFFLLYPVFNSMLYSGNKHISSIILTVLYGLMYIPFTTCVYAGILTIKYIILNLVYWTILMIFGLSKLKKRIRPLPKIRIDKWKINNTFLTFISITSLILVFFVWGYYGKFRLNFNVFNIYNLRVAARNYNMTTFVTYIFKWTRAINPILLAYCLVNNKYLSATCFFIAQLVSFNVDGLKSTLFMPFVVLVIVKFYNKIPIDKIKYWIIYGLTCVSIVGVFELEFLNSSYIIELFTRRVSILTNYICDCYCRFFSDNPPDYFRGTLLRPLGIESPYYDIGKIIGDKYIHAGMNCNSGLFSDAIANLGIIGCFIMPIIVVEVLHILDRSSINIDRRITIASGLYISYLLLSSFLSTVLITHGLLISILLFWMMNDQQKEIKYEI